MQSLIEPIDTVRGESLGAGRERFFRQLVDCSLDIITVLDEHGIVRFENPAAHQLLGYQPDELIGRSVFDLIHPEDRPVVLQAFLGVLEQPGQTASAEFRFQNKDGSWRYLAAVGKNLLHEPGIAGVIVNSRDVTQKKVAVAELRESEERFRQLTENIDEVFWISDASITKMYYISPAYEKIWGRSCESVMKSPRSFLDAVHPDDREELLASLAANEVGRPYSIEYRIIRPDGAVRWISDRGFPVFDQHGAVHRCAGIAEDVTAKVRDQAQLRLQSSALSAAANSIFITDKQGRIMWVNAAFCRLSGFAIEELIDQTPRILKSGKHDAGFYQHLWQTVLAGRVWSGEVVERRKNGELYTVHQTITPLTDGCSEITHFIAVHEDITARKDAEARIEHLAFHDPLTGLCNRVELHNRLEQAVQQAKRHSRSLALHFIDLDRFKVVNDTLGHSVGDSVLQAVATRLEGCLRESDTAARIGGDEFAVLQPELANPEGAATLASRIVGAMADPFRVCGHDIHISPSIGISFFPLDSSEPDELLRNADMAMYLAKNEGRNNFQFFTSALNDQLRDRLALESDLHAALGSGEFVLHFQPQVSLRTRRLTGMEARFVGITNWRARAAEHVYRDRGRVWADSGDQPVGVGASMRQNAAWQAAELPCRRIAVNVSSANFKRGDLCQIIADVLAPRAFRRDTWNWR